MVSDKLYELCQPILKDGALDEEDKTDQLEALLRKEAELDGRALQDAILKVLWRYRDATVPPPVASPSTKAAQLRRGSPAPWQVPRTVSATSPALAGASPVPSHAVTQQPAPFPRVRSSAASPFASPRPSPRLAFTSPIPHSPSLQQYEFSEPSATGGGMTSAPDYGDYGSDTVDWLVGDEGPSRPSSSGAGSSTWDGGGLSGAAAPWAPQPQPAQAEMSPFDMLRSILGEARSDEEIEASLEAHGYDLSATIVALMGMPGPMDEQGGMAPDGQVLIGKNMLPSQPIPIGQAPGPAKSNTICKYWIATGNCLRADCRFSHEYGTTICRYWLMGNCLAGDTCVFSHDPQQLMASLNLGGGNQDPDFTASGQPSFQVQDFDSFPQLVPGGLSPWTQGQFHGGYPFARPGSSRGLASEGSTGGSNFINSSPRSHGSRPTSRHSSRAVTPSLPAVDDTDAFPTLGAGSGSGSIGRGKKHHGKRGHGHAHAGNKENAVPGSLADVVRMSPSPAPAGLLRKGLVKTRSYGAAGREASAVVASIPAPERIPWLETGERANQTYLKARQEAFKHGGLRNKFLQSAAQAWNRNDARAAKALSLRGQSENDLMRKAHREGARALYEARNQHRQGGSTDASAEAYVDLHGLHPEEATEYLAHALTEHRGIAGATRPVYAITGTGHHSKGGKDKVGRAVRTWLMERGFVYREFSVPGDRGNVGGILGIDARTGKVDVEGVGEVKDPREMEEGRDTKVRVLKEVPTGPRLRG